MLDVGSARWAGVDAAIEDQAEAAFAFPRTPGRGAEHGRRRARRPGDRGGRACPARLRGRRATVPESTARAAPGGVAQASYAGRPNMVGRMNRGAGPSLLLNGHIDVVPAEAALWSSDPFAPSRSGGWLSWAGGRRHEGRIRPRHPRDRRAAQRAARGAGRATLARTCRLATSPSVVSASTETTTRLMLDFDPQPARRSGRTRY